MSEDEEKLVMARQLLTLVELKKLNESQTITMIFYISLVSIGIILSVLLYTLAHQSRINGEKFDKMNQQLEQKED